MNLADMKLAAQDAFMQKRIGAKFFQEWAPERCLKILAVLEAARDMNEENFLTLCVSSDIDQRELLTDAGRNLADAFETVFGYAPRKEI